MIPDELVRNGVVCRAEVLAAGVHERTWLRWHEAGRLVAMFRGASLVAGTEPSFERRALAAVLSVGRDALASHRTAARLWGVERPTDDDLDVTVPVGRAPRPRTGVAIHRTRTPADLEPSTPAGVPSTNPLRLLVDLGDVAPNDVARTLSHLVITKLITVTGARAAVERHSIPGRPGVGALRAALREWPLGDDRPDSELELDIARLLRGAGIQGFVFHPRIEGFEVDFAHRGARLIVEGDGHEFHGDRAAFERDRHRDLVLAAAGWTVVRLTWIAVHRRPDETIDALRRALAGRV